MIILAVVDMGDNYISHAHSFSISLLKYQAITMILPQMRTKITKAVLTQCTQLLLVEIVICIPVCCLILTSLRSIRLQSYNVLNIAVSICLNFKSTVQRF